MYLPAVLRREPCGRDGEGEQEDEIDGDGAEEAVGEGEQVGRGRAEHQPAEDGGEAVQAAGRHQAAPRPQHRHHHQPACSRGMDISL